MLKKYKKCPCNWHRVAEKNIKSDIYNNINGELSFYTSQEYTELVCDRCGRLIEEE